MLVAVAVPALNQSKNNGDAYYKGSCILGNGREDAAEVWNCLQITDASL